MCERIIAALLIAVASGHAAAADWPTHQHDVRRSGVTAQRLDAAKLGEAWRYTPPHPPAVAWYGPARWDAFARVMNMRSMRNYDAAPGVVVSGGLACFASSADDTVRCVDAATGEPRWTFTTGGPVRITPTFAGDRVYFGSDDGYAYCLDAASGELVWKTAAGPTDQPYVIHNSRLISRWPVRTGVLVDGGTAYFAGSMLPWDASYLCAVDAATGKIEGEGRYTRKLDGAYTFEGWMLASGGQLVSPQGRVAPLLFNRATGEPMGSLSGGGGCLVLLTPDAQLLHGPGNKDAQIYATDPANLKAKIASFEGGNAIVVDGERSYLLTDTELVAVDRKQRRRLWATPTDVSLSLVMGGDVLFAGGVDAVAAYDAATGGRVWSSPVRGRAYAMAVADGRLMVSTDEGVIHCFAAGGAAIAATRFGEPIGIDGAAGEAKAVLDLSEPGAIGHWVFDRGGRVASAVKDRTGHGDARVSGGVRIERAGPYEAMRVDGLTSRIVLSEDLGTAKLPRGALTAMAWVRIDEAPPWGGIIGAIQDNGDKEFGWLLGHHERRLFIAVASEGTGKLTYLESPADFAVGRWVHVAGTYDGARMTLMVNGEVVATSDAQSGAIRYPQRGWYEMAAYHDDDENYPMRGALHEVAVYDRALEPSRIAAGVKAKLMELPAAAVEPMEAAVGPWVTFDSPTSAVVRWTTEKPTASRVVLISGDEQRVIESGEAATTEHAVRLSDLRRNRMYHYAVEERDGDTVRRTQEYECDTFFNYGVRPTTDAARAMASEADAAAARRVIEASGVDRGVVVMRGVERAGLAAAITAGSAMRVVIVDTDAAAVDTLRRKLVEAGVNGSRIEAHAAATLEAVRIDGAMANVVVIGEDAGEGELEWARRIAAPDGGVVVRLGGSGEVVSRWKRPALAGAGDWTHQYGEADNSSFGGETLGGVTTTGQMRVQWVGRPGPRYQSDREHRKPAPLAIGGRLLLQGYKRLIALDQYNGSVLWSIELPTMVRFNVARDCANWCADREHVYVAIDGHMWRIDAATGQVLSRTAVEPGRRQGWAWDFGYIARVGELVIGSTVRRGTAFEHLFEKGAWFDDLSGPFSLMGASDALFALEAGGGATRWRYDGGLVLNPTVTIGEGRVWFVEVRSEAIVRGEERRLGSAEMWKDMHLVALDAATGAKVYERRIEPTPGFSMTMAYGSGRLVLVTSAGGSFDVTAYDAASGERSWGTAYQWENKGEIGAPAGHHGSHLQRPAIVHGRVFLRPAVLDLRTGQRVGDIGKPGHGCGSYTATAYGLLLRSGNLSMWDARTNTMSDWTRVRPDCWISTIPAGGMVLSPEGGGGCSCGSWMETSLGFMPIAPGPGPAPTAPAPR